MAPTLPIVVPLGLVVMVIALAIYYDYVSLDHPRAVTVKASSNTSLPIELLRRWLA